MVAINTHTGLYKVNRLPFGVSSAPSIFQRIMENLLQGIPGVVVYRRYACHWKDYPGTPQHPQYCSLSTQRCRNETKTRQMLFSITVSGIPWTLHLC